MELLEPDRVLAAAHAAPGGVRIADARPVGGGYYGDVDLRAVKKELADANDSFVYDKGYHTGALWDQFRDVVSKFSIPYVLLRRNFSSTKTSPTSHRNSQQHQCDVIDKTKIQN